MFRPLLAALILLAAPLGPAASRSENLRDALEPLAKANDFSGVVLVARGGRVEVETFGYADVELRVPMARTTKMYIGSLSKGFTAYAILQLRDAGRLTLDDRLSRFVPEFPGAADITIAHLLTHRSGLTQNTTLPAHFEQARRSYSTAEAVGLFANEPRAAAPGEKEIYANPNYTLLALVIERASGETFGAYMASHVFAPMGLKHTAHHDTARRIVPGRARGYSPLGMTGLENSRWNRLLHRRRRGLDLLDGGRPARVDPHGCRETRAGGLRVERDRARRPHALRGRRVGRGRIRRYRGLAAGGRRVCGRPREHQHLRHRAGRLRRRVRAREWTARRHRITLSLRATRMRSYRSWAAISSARTSTYPTAS